MGDIVIRGIGQKRSAGRVVESFDAALALSDYPEREAVIEWSGTDAIAALDIDWHGTQPPHRNRLWNLVCDLHIHPRFWWVSHGGGLKLIYLANKILKAGEVAAVARLVFRKFRTGETGIEIASRTRHPSYERNGQRCGVVESWKRLDEVGKVKSLLLGDFESEADLDPDLLEGWMADEGWCFGQRFPHSKCPIDKSEGSKNDPVVVLDGGVFCHSCEAKGATYPGMSKPGFVPWARLMDGAPCRVRHDLRAAVKHCTHWEHARHIADGDEVGYRALLKLWHMSDADDTQRPAVEARIQKVFSKKLPIVRGNGVWLDATTFAPVSRDGLDLLIQSLPAVSYVDEKGKSHTDPMMLGTFKGAFDLTKYGYPAITPLRGVDIGGPDRDPLGIDDRIYAVAQALPPFKYRDAEERKKHDYEDHIRSCFPGVDLDLLRLLIAAKGVVQSGRFQNVPQLYITGQSGAGKSAHVLLAAHMSCDTAQIIEVDQCDANRLLQQYAAASERGGFALFNESDKGRLKDDELRNLVLKFEREKGYHAMYRGRATIDSPAVVTYTGQVLPELLRRDAQTARRVIHIDFGAGILRRLEKVNWHASCGTGTISEWRRFWIHNEVGDAFTSDVMDRFFGEQMSWESIVAELGFAMLADAAGGDAEAFRRLFDLACAGTPDEWSRYKRDEGWVAFRATDSNSPLAAAYRDVAAGDDGRDSVQTVLAADWGGVVGVPGVECEVKAHGERRAIRFRLGKARAEGTRLNGAILGSCQPAAA